MAHPQPIVDAWMQHPTPRMLAHPMFDTLKRWTNGAAVAEVPTEFTLGAMDAAGVGRAMLNAWSGPGGGLISNDEVAALAAARPGRFFGVCAVDVSRPMDAVRELRSRVRGGGFKALRILQWIWNLPSDHRLFYPLYAECCELGVPVCLQAGHTGPLCPSEPGRPIPYMDHVALEFPELKIVAGHVGFPWVDEVVSLAMKYPNFYIDTSAYKASRYPPELVAYLRGPGRRKVLFGSNYPMIAPADALAGLEALGLDDDARSRFLWRNAEAVFGLDPA